MIGRLHLLIGLLALVLSACAGDDDKEKPKDPIGEDPPPVTVMVEPAQAKVSVGASLRFQASVEGADDEAVSWSLPEDSAGTIDEAGLYQAPEVAGTYRVVATSVADPEVSAEATVSVVEGIAVWISPSQLTLEMGETERFEAHVTGTDDLEVVWSVEEGGGSIGEDGTYTAPMAEGSFTIHATAKADPESSASATVTVRAPVGLEVIPTGVSMETGETTQFQASVHGTDDGAVTWEVLETGGGTIDDTGLYQAPDTEGLFTVQATSVADTRRSATAKVEVRAPVAVEIDPATSSLEVGETIQLQATVTGASDTSVTWEVLEAEGGSISADGLYQAPDSPGTFTVQATSVADPRRSATAQVTVRPQVAVAISPETLRLQFGDVAKFQATVTGAEDKSVRWSVVEAGGGAISSSGQYMAPAAAGTFTVQAVSVADPRRSATAQVTVRPPVAVAVSPTTSSLEFGETTQFSATVTGAQDTSVVWSVVEPNGGSIDANGLYQAPQNAGTFTVVATSAADARRSATAQVDVRPPVEVSVTPPTVSLEFGETAQFQATVTGNSNTRVNWSVDEPGGGAISSSGQYVAPQRVGTFTVRATSSADPKRSATAVVEVRRPIEVVITPGFVTVEQGETTQFQAVVTGTTNTQVQWSIQESNGGTISSSGQYEAPQRNGTFTILATSVEDPRRSATAHADVVEPDPIDLSIIPADRRTVWNPGIPDGIPQQRQVHTQLSGIPTNGTGNVATAIQNAIDAAGSAYQNTGVIQEVVLPAGTFRFTSTLNMRRSGVVLRGQGTNTRLRYDGNQSTPAILFGQGRWTNYGSNHGPWNLSSNGNKGSYTITLSASNANNILPGDILAIDEEEAPYVRRGDGWYGKRQPSSDTHGPALRGSGLYRSVGSIIEVVQKQVSGNTATLTLREPLHMDFRTSRYAQVWHIATPRSPFNEVQYAGLEDLYLTGGTIKTNNVSYSWIDGLEVDGNPGTYNVGSYNNQGGITGHSVELFHAYRFEVRNSYIHHSRSISQGGGSYLIELGGYTSESLIEDNIVLFGNKLIVGNMMGGGNVIAYNYVDNARTNSSTWQEGAIDLCHLAFTHNALVEGNWTSNMGADTTHGNSGWHVFHRNFATGQNSNPVYGSYPYTSGQPDTSFRRAVGVDGYTRETTFIGNVLHAGNGTPVYQVDHTGGSRLSAAAVWRIGGAVDGQGDRLDDGTALSLLYRHGNWDSATGNIVWDPSNNIQDIPDSFYLTGKPAFFGNNDWPWINPKGSSHNARVGVLPAKARYDALYGN